MALAVSAARTAGEQGEVPVGAVVVLVTSAERARDLKQRPVYVMGAVQGGDSNWGRGMLTQNQLGDDLYASAGGKYDKPVAKASKATAKLEKAER